MKHPISEFCAFGTPDSKHVLDRLVEYHVIPINIIERSVDVRIHSCYRPEKHEEKNDRYTDAHAEKNGLVKLGRDFWSQHRFLTERDPKGKGAIDLSSSQMPDMHELVMRVMKPTRIARYRTFIHYDWAYPERGVRYFNSSWRQITRDEFWDTL